MLTGAFQARLQSELRDQLQLALGKLAIVDVVRAHPLLDDIRSKGMAAVLASWDELTPIQTHFVFVDFEAGQYRIETGCHDGMTGLSSPVVRKAALGDRQRVSDTAVDMVRKSFAMVGTFDRLEGSEVNIALKGAGLEETLDPWVRAGDIFAVVRVSSSGGKTHSSLVEMAVLRAVESPRAGMVRCRYFCRWAGDRHLAEGAIGDGYRCVKLDAKRGPVRLRLVHDKTLEFLAGLRIQVASNEDFSGDKKEGVVDNNGYFEAKELFTNVAYVRVKSGERILVEFPLPLLDDRAMVCRMSPNPDAFKQGELEQRKDRWVRWYIEALTLSEQRSQEYNQALSVPNPTKQTLDAALKLGRQHLQEMETESLRLDAERKNLLLSAGKFKLSMEEGDQLAEALQRRKKSLAKSLADLETAILQADSDKTRNLIAMNQRAELLEKQCEFARAIELYETVVRESDSAPVKAHLKALKEQWAIQNHAHEVARRFVYEEWPNFDLVGVKANISKARQALQVFKDAGDVKTPLKLLMVSLNHIKSLTKELEVLRKAPDGEDAQTRLKALLPLASELPSLQREAAAWVKGKQ